MGAKIAHLRFAPVPELKVLNGTIVPKSSIIRKSPNSSDASKVARRHGSRVILPIEGLDVIEVTDFPSV